MSAIVVNEFAKMRHLHVVLLVAVLFAVVTGIGLYAAVFNPDFDRTSASSWNTLLMGMGSGFTLAAPLLLAVVASRLVDAEHQGGGWLMSATSGVTPGGLCRAKLLALGLLVAGPPCSSARRSPRSVSPSASTPRGRLDAGSV